MLIRALLASSALMLALTLAGCEKRDGDATKSSDAASTQNGTATKEPAIVDVAASDVILLGEVGALTGNEATFGISTQRGIQMAIDEANARGGVKLADGSTKKLDVRVYDDQGKPDQAANAVTRLITQDKVKLILGEVVSSNSLAMAAKAQEAQIPMISPSSTNAKVTEVGDYIFRVCFIDPFQGKVMAKFTDEHLKAKTVALLKDNKSDYSLGVASAFTEEYQKRGGTIIAEESYSKGDTDFRGQLTAIKGKKPAAIFIPGYYTDVGVIARQARELGIPKTVPLLGGDGWESEKLFELGGSAIEGSYYSNHYSPDDPSPAVQNFIKTYKGKFDGQMPDAFAALGYDAAAVAIAALERAKDLSGPALRDAIAATKDFPGVAGKVTIDEKRNAQKPAVVLQVKDGKTAYVSTINP